MTAPAEKWTTHVDVKTATGRGCPACLWPMPTDIRFETETSVFANVDVVQVRVLALSFPCPGCGIALRFLVGGHGGAG